jgi:hypothetical protein
MQTKHRTMIVTGSAKGIGVGVTNGFIERGDVGDPATACEIDSKALKMSDIADIVDAIVYLTEARHVTGEVLHVGAGAHSGK